jgi:glutamate transport system substrate-binding protein
MEMEGTMRVHSTRTARFTVGALAVVGAIVLAGCTDSSAPDPDTDPTEESSGMPEVPYEEGTTMADLAESGTIRIGVKTDQPLFGLTDATTGDPEGFDVEMGKIIADQLGIDEGSIEWVNTVSANREPFLQNDQVDIVIATYTINDARKELVGFAGPYYIAGQDILVAAGNPEGITGPEWFEENPDATICTQTGSTSINNIGEYTSNVLASGSYADCLEPIRNGQAVAVTTDNVILSGLAYANEGEFELLNAPFTEEPYGIGVPLDDTELRSWINDVLDAAFESGEWARAWEDTVGVVIDLPDSTPTVDRY